MPYNQQVINAMFDAIHPCWRKLWLRVRYGKKRAIDVYLGIDDEPFDASPFPPDVLIVPASLAQLVESLVTNPPADSADKTVPPPAPTGPADSPR